MTDIDNEYIAGFNADHDAQWVASGHVVPTNPINGEYIDLPLAPEPEPDDDTITPGADGWTKPSSALTPPLPDFPTKRLPVVLAEMVEAVSAEIQTPAAMAAMLALAVAASTVAGKIEVAGRPGHVEQLPLWTFTAANSAERKTPVFNRLRAPLVEFEKQHDQENRLERRQMQSRVRVMEGRIKSAEAAAIKNGSTGGSIDIDQLQEQLDGLRVPPSLMLWASSPTPEAVHELLSEHEGRMAVFSDEGGMFGIIAGRYTGGKGGADLDPFLSGYVGSPLRAPRVTAERRNVPAAFLTMSFAVQPSVLSDLGGVAAVEERGLIGRWLFALPEPKIGSRSYGGSVQVPEDVAQAYDRTVTHWASLAVPDTRHVLRLSPEAYEVYADFHDRIEARLRDGSDLAKIGTWGGKIAGTTLRVAALLHIYTYKDAINREIETQVIRDAIALTQKFFIPHALAAFRVLRHGSEKSTAHRVVSWLNRTKLAAFTLNDAFQALKSGTGGKVTSKADVEPSLEFLCQGGYIRVAEHQPRKDSVRYEVNPLWDFT